MSEPDDPPLPVRRPPAVTRAFWLWLAVAGCLVVSALLLALASTADLEAAVRDAFARQSQNVSDESVASTARTIRITGVTADLVLAVSIAGVAALGLRAGRNVGRIALCVLGALAVLVGLLGFSGNLILTVLELVAGVVAAYFMFRRDTKDFFAR
jgi:hypothetical protein